MDTAAEEFTPIRVSTLRGDLEIPFDVYVRVAGKYIHYCRQGTSFEGQRLDRLRSKNLKKLFIRPEDSPAYEQYLDASISAAYANIPQKPLDMRAEVVQGYQLAQAEAYMEDPLDEAAYKNMRSSIHRMVDFLDREPGALEALLKVKNTDFNIAHHCVNVAALAIAIALEGGQRDGAPIHLLALGCMLHDIDHAYTCLNVGRPVNALAPEEVEIYRNHPFAGARRFQGVTFVDQLVFNVITQHEEHRDGSGFPKGLKETDMDPMIMIAATANAYDRLASFEGKEPKDALKTLLIDKMGVFPLPHLQTLQKVLKKQKIV